MAAPLPSRRWLRAAVLLGAGWLVLEFVLGQLIAERIGGGPTVLFLSIKGGIGILMVGALALSGLKRLGKGGPGRKGLDLAFSLASAVLITLPGLVPTLIGIALFAPSVRSWVLRQFKTGAPEAPRDFDLAPNDWREVRTRRIARKTKPRLKGEARAEDAKTLEDASTPESESAKDKTSAGNTLEAKPPSV